MATTVRSPLIYAVQKQDAVRPQLLNFHDCARGVDWPSILAYAEKNIDIVAYYWTSWVDAYAVELKKFLSRPGTKLRLVMADPRNPLILKEIRKIFPEHSEAELFTKIRGTQKKLNEILESIEGPKGTLEFFLLPRVLSYPCQRIDNEIVIYSIFEMYRQRKVDAPATVVNLLESPHLRQFFDKEWEGFLREGIRCDLSKLIG